MVRASLIFGDKTGGKVLTLDLDGGGTVEEILGRLGYPPTTYLVKLEGRFVPSDMSLPEGGTVEVTLVRGEMPGGFASGAGARVEFLRPAAGTVEAVAPATEAVAPTARVAGGRDGFSVTAPGVPRCDFCGRPAVTVDRFAGSATNILRVHRCAQCFLSEVRRRALGVCRWHGLVRPGDHVLAPLSGGKDSAAELFFLSEIAREERSIRLTAYTLRLGSSRYFALNLERATQLAAQLGVPHLTLDVADYYGTTLEAAVNAHPEAVRRLGPCAVCAATRRMVERDLVTQLGVTVVTTGDTRTDQRRHLLWGFFQETRWRLAAHPSRPDPIAGTVRVSPLFDLDDHETALTTQLAGLPAVLHQEAECPFATLTLRGRQTEAVERLEGAYPGLFLQARSRMLGLLEGPLQKVGTAGDSREEGGRKTCPVCGEQRPLRHETCPICAAHSAYGLNLPGPRGGPGPKLPQAHHHCPTGYHPTGYLLHPETRWIGRRPGGWLLFTPDRRVLTVTDEESAALLKCDGAAGAAEGETGLSDPGTLARFLADGLVRSP